MTTNPTDLAFARAILRDAMGMATNATRDSFGWGVMVNENKSWCDAIFADADHDNDPTRSLFAAFCAAFPVASTRKWQREYPEGKAWFCWIEGQGRCLNLWVVEPEMVGHTSLHDDTWCLPYRKGDTESNLPPLPPEARKAP